MPAVRKQTTAAFLAALTEGYMKTVVLMLDSSISVSATDKLGRTALHLAICLKQNNTSLQVRQRDRQPARQTDRQADRHLIGKPLPDKSCSPTPLTPYSTPTQICRSLLGRGSDVNCGDLFGMTPFSYAVSSQNIAMVR
eukprot:sb/3474392/